jgi:protein involved in polysaccharide export with SLBB domain
VSFKYGNEDALEDHDWHFPLVWVDTHGRLLSGGCRTPRTNHVFSPLPADGVHDAGSDAATYRFAVGDLITVRFADTNQISPQEERIKEDGTITLPLIGAVKAAGKTPEELQREIHELYGPRYYQPSWVPGVRVQRIYYVGGQVNQPGRQVYLGPTTVTKAIESAGGFTEFTRGTRVELTRNDGKRFIVNCIKAAKDPSLDLPVYPGDKISVPMQYVPDIYR